jgi:thiamine kinase-like enzyme
MQEIGARPQASVLCHNDLLRANRLHSAGRLWAIDWEYCAMGDPWFDLAVVATGDQLDGAQRTALLKAYLHREPTSDDYLNLHRHNCVYRYLELLWHGVVQRQGADDEGFARRLERLQTSLGCGPQD